MSNSPQPFLMLQPEADPPLAEREGAIIPPLKACPESGRRGKRRNGGVMIYNVTLCIK